MNGPLMNTHILSFPSAGECSCVERGQRCSVMHADECRRCVPAVALPPHCLWQLSHSLSRANSVATDPKRTWATVGVSGELLERGLPSGSAKSDFYNGLLMLESNRKYCALPPPFPDLCGVTTSPQSCDVLCISSHC